MKDGSGSSSSSSSDSDDSDDDKKSESSNEHFIDLEDDDGHDASYQKTKNEITDAAEIEKLAPKFDQERLDSLDSMEEFGSVIQYVSEGNGIILIMPSDSQKLYDLDNIICLPESVDKELDKLVVGFLSDVVGPVSMPLYTVHLY